MITLSEREHLVAEQYCKGLADKEVADSLQRSEWTIKAQKRDIYKNWVFPKIPSLYYTCSVSA